MSVVSVVKLFEGQSATHAEAWQYTVVYQVEVDDPSDGAKVVLAAAGIPAIRDLYSFGNDSDSTAVCTARNPSRVSGTRLVWLVEATFATLEHDDKGFDPDGQESDDPDDWREEFDVQAAMFTVPVWVATLRTTLSGTREADTVGPVINSAGVVFDPPPEIEISNEIIRITRYGRQYPNTLASYANAINDDVVTITRPAGYSRQFPKYALKMMPVTSSLNYHRASSGVVIAYWKYSIELHERYLQTAQDVLVNWRIKLVDRGYSARATAGDYDGLGGTVVPAQLAQGMPHNRGLYDFHGEAIREPVNLNLQGAPAPNGSHYYITYSGLPEKAFGQLGL